MVGKHVTTSNPYIGYTLRRLSEKRRVVEGYIRASENLIHASEMLMGRAGMRHIYTDVKHQVDMWSEVLGEIDLAIKLTTEHYYADCPCPEIPVMGMGEVSYNSSCNCLPPPSDYRLPDGFVPIEPDVPF